MVMTRYLLVEVLDQLIGSTHMIIRELMEHRIKVEILVRDGLVVTTSPTHLIVTNSEGTGYDSYDPYESYGDTYSRTSLPCYHPHPHILQQYLLTTYNDMMYNFGGTQISHNYPH